MKKNIFLILSAFFVLLNIRVIYSKGFGPDYYPVRTAIDNAGYRPNLPLLRKTLNQVTTYSPTSREFKLVKHRAGIDPKKIDETTLYNNDLLRRVLGVIEYRNSTTEQFQKNPGSDYLKRQVEVANEYIDILFDHAVGTIQGSQSNWGCNNFVGKRLFSEHCAQLQKMLDDLM